MQISYRVFFSLNLLGLLLMSCGSSKTSVPEFDNKYDSLNAQILDQPNNAELYGLRGDWRVEDGEFDPALFDYNRAIELDSLNDQWYVRKAKLLIEMKEIGRAKKMLDEAIYIVPGSTDIMLLTSELYFWAGDFQKSINWSNAALGFDKFLSKAYYLKGMAHKSSGDTSKAVSNFRTAVEQNPKDYDSYIQLGQLFELANHPLAAEYYRIAVELKPESMDALYASGLAYQNRGDLDKAKNQYFTMLQLDDKSGKALYNLGYIHLILEENIDSGLFYFDKTVSIYPNYDNAQYNLGYCYELLGNEKGALEKYKYVLSISPSHTLAAKGVNRLTD